MKYAGIALLIVASVLGFYLLLFRNKTVRLIEVDGGNIGLQVEIVDDDVKRAKGLMYREHLDENSGMLFIFPYSNRHSFWMANTKIPLDIIWIDQDWEVVFIQKSAEPCTYKELYKCPSYTPDKAALYVLEVNGGWTDKNGIEIGSKLRLL